MVTTYAATSKLTALLNLDLHGINYKKKRLELSPMYVHVHSTNINVLADTKTHKQLYESDCSTHDRVHVDVHVHVGTCTHVGSAASPGSCACSHSWPRRTPTAGWARWGWWARTGRCRRETPRSIPSQWGTSLPTPEWTQSTWWASAAAPVTTYTAAPGGNTASTVFQRITATSTSIFIATLLCPPDAPFPLELCISSTFPLSPWKVYLGAFTDVLSSSDASELVSTKNDEFRSYTVMDR